MLRSLPSPGKWSFCSSFARFALQPGWRGAKVVQANAEECVWELGSGTAQELSWDAGLIPALSLP